MAGLSKAQTRLIHTVAARHGVKSVRVFGSMARGTADSGSDVDLLVRFAEPVSLLQVIGFQQAVSEALNMEVDVVEEGGVSPYMRDRILGEAIWL